MEFNGPSLAGAHFFGLYFPAEDFDVKGPIIRFIETNFNPEHKVRSFCYFCALNYHYGRLLGS